MEEMITREQTEKLEKLQKYLRSLESVAVAFSSGVDSTFLLKVAKDTLGDKVMAVTAQSCSFPKRELKEAIAFCEKEGIKHVICESEELSIEGFAQNPKNRCYLCKKELFEKIQKIAADNGMKAIVEGSNLDDTGDYRPGLQAVAELGIKSPLRHCDLTKADIRALSHYLHLPTWEKQSFACLSSRFVYGETITEEKLGMVDKAEQLLLDMGISSGSCSHFSVGWARIEIEPSEFGKLMEDENREKNCENTESVRIYLCNAGSDGISYRKYERDIISI